MRRVLSRRAALIGGSALVASPALAKWPAFCPGGQQAPANQAPNAPACAPADGVNPCVPCSSMTWNAAGDNHGLYISPSGLTTRNISPNVGWARSNNPQTTGLYYFEVTINVNGGSNTWFGIGNASATWDYTAAGGVVCNPYIQYCYVNGSFQGVVLPNVPWSTLLWGVSGVTVGIAVNFTTSKIWFRWCPPLVGTWNNNGAANPSTGVGGISFSAITGGNLYALMSNVASFTTETNTTNFGALPFIGAVPTGFQAWPGQIQSVPGTWTTTRPYSQINLLAASATDAIFNVTTDGGIFGSTPAPAGLTTWSIQFAGAFAQAIIGVANPSVDFTTVGNTGLNAAGVYCSLGTLNGQAWVNGSSIVTLPTISQGSILNIALNTRTNKIWFKDATFGGTWNNNGAANPNTGVGGIDVSAIATGGLTPFAATYHTTFSGAGDSAQWANPLPPCS